MIFASKGEMGGNVRCGAKWSLALSNVVGLSATTSDFLRDQNEDLLEIVFGDPFAGNSLSPSFCFFFPFTSAEPNLRKDDEPNDMLRVLCRRSSSYFTSMDDLSRVKSALLLFARWT